MIKKRAIIASILAQPDQDNRNSSTALQSILSSAPKLLFTQRICGYSIHIQKKQKKIQNQEGTSTKKKKRANKKATWIKGKGKKQTSCYEWKYPKIIKQFSKVMDDTMA